MGKKSGNVWEKYGIHHKSQIHFFEKIFLWEMDRNMGYMIDIWEDNMGSNMG